ncbi:cytochrome c2 [Bacillus ectoiniformans]|uniref:serine protease n=1 Tax=Bacillus ectoiniformans TaxID=1494429 RepID=UPI001956B854|nr:serine protease [Bacillus ectoiniformans]MBM7648660.1 cytochrome c2 [Bacillus ectoiniformans]
MEVHQIEEKMKQLRLQLFVMEERKKEIQEKCTHDFTGNEHYQTCRKCHKVEVLYY